jgi:hypothetical protein
VTATVKAITDDVTNALIDSSMSTKYVAEALDALGPLIARIAGQLTEDRDRANRLARAHVDTADEIDTKVKAAIVAAFRDAAREWAEEDDDNSAEDLLPDYRSSRARAAHERARQIEDGEIDL